MEFVREDSFSRKKKLMLDFICPVLPTAIRFMTAKSEKQ
jgi:hypothetical protein